MATSPAAIASSDRPASFDALSWQSRQYSWTNVAMRRDRRRVGSRTARRPRQSAGGHRPPRGPRDWPSSRPCARRAGTWRGSYGARTVVSIPHVHAPPRPARVAPAAHVIERVRHRRARDRSRRHRHRGGHPACAHHCSELPEVRGLRDVRRRPLHRAVRPETESRTDYPIEVVQAGRRTGADVPPDFPPIPLERTSVTGLRHVDGVVSMARGGADTATSDFFICLGDQPTLDAGGDATPTDRASPRSGGSSRGWRSSAASSSRRWRRQPARAGRHNRAPCRRSWPHPSTCSAPTGSRHRLTGSGASHHPHCGEAVSDLIEVGAHVSGRRRERATNIAGEV